MKLYEVPRDSLIQVGDEFLIFHHIDGMYSYCTNEDGDVFHLPAWTEVEVIPTPKPRPIN